MPFFGNVERFCFFLATDRSGHSVTAQMLNAHRDILIADELDVLWFVEQGFTREQIFALIWYQDNRFQRRQRRKSGYSYDIPGSWQGKPKTPRVIGDKKGMRTAWRLVECPELLARLRAVVGLPLRVIVHLRHPLDSIATQARRADEALPAIVESYFERIDSLSRAAALLSQEEKLVQAHEDVLADSRAGFTRMCRFLEVEPEEMFLDQVGDKLFASARQTRDQFDWPESLLAQVRRRSEACPLLAPYVGTF